MIDDSKLRWKGGLELNMDAKDNKLILKPKK
jgi:hypothetical protein